MDLIKYMLDKDLEQPQFLSYSPLKPLLIYRWDPVLLSSCVAICRENEKGLLEVNTFDYIEPDSEILHIDKKDKNILRRFGLVMNQKPIKYDNSFKDSKKRLLEFFVQEQIDGLYITEKTRDGDPELDLDTMVLAAAYLNAGISIMRKIGLPLPQKFD